jgi:hypothetical protein
MQHVPPCSCLHITQNSLCMRHCVDSAFHVRTNSHTSCLPPPPTRISSIFAHLAATPTHCPHRTYLRP